MRLILGIGEGSNYCLLPSTFAEEACELFTT